MERQRERLSVNRRMNPKMAGEQIEGSPTVGNFSKRNCERLERARLSISFSETNKSTSCPRSRKTSATAMPGKRCPPVPPHAITAFISVIVDLLRLNSRRHTHLERGAFFVSRFQNGLSINIQQQPNTK